MSSAEEVGEDSGSAEGKAGQESPGGVRSYIKIGKAEQAAADGKRNQWNNWTIHGFWTKIQVWIKIWIFLWHRSSQLKSNWKESNTAMRLEAKGAMSHFPYLTLRKIIFFSTYDLKNKLKFLNILPQTKSNKNFFHLPKLKKFEGTKIFTWPI